MPNAPERPRNQDHIAECYDNVDRLFGTLSLTPLTPEEQKRIDVLNEQAIKNRRFKGRNAIGGKKNTMFK